MSGTVLGCIADDFTGATDLAGILQRSGAQVSLRTGLPDVPPDAETKAIEIIALKCRTIAASDAVAQATAALKWLREAGANRLFWKYCSTFDSTAKGNIGPVAEALMAQLGVSQTIYCPAFPENGRSVFMGHLFVGNQLLSESPMRDHPLTPMRDSSLVRLLQPQVEGQVGLIDKHCLERGTDHYLATLKQLEKEGTAHVVVDATNAADLETAAKAVRTHTLLTGGSAVAQTLPQLLKGDGADIALGETSALPNVAGGSIVLSGSCSAMTRKQVSAFASQFQSCKIEPIAIARDGTAYTLEWLDSADIEKPVMIYATAEPADVARAQDELGAGIAGEMIERALAQVAVRARDLGRRRIVVAGGETSGAVTNALGITQMIVGKEIEPGVPWSACESESVPLALALKSGNFGTETFFADALAMLERP